VITQDGHSGREIPKDFHRRKKLTGGVLARAANTRSTSMSITEHPANIAALPKKQRGHSKPLPVTIDLSQPGRLRVGHVMSLLSISHATLYARLREGTIPPPDGKDGKRPHWKTATIRAFLDA
jgi:predicted DNA-binding transcriptional regulator AlpA